MKLTPATLRAVYDFLRRVAFDDDKNLPPSRAVRFVARRSKFHGYLVYERQRYTIGVDTVGTTSVDLLLQIMSHEMIHLCGWTSTNSPPGKPSGFPLPVELR